MFGNNNKISHIQMERQYQLVFFTPLILFASKELQGGIGILSVLIVMPLVWLSLLWMKRNAGKYRNNQKMENFIILKIRVFFYQIFLVIAGVFVVAQATRLVTEYMVQGAPRWLVMVMFVLVSLALGSEAEVRGRFAEIAWPAVAGIIAIFFFFAFWQGAKMIVAENMEIARTVNFQQIRSGFWKFSGRELWKNIVTLLAFMTGIVLFPFVDIHQEKKDTKNLFLFRMVLKLTIWLVLAIVLQHIYFGAKGTENLNYPMLDLMSSVKLPGNFVRRLDLIFLTVMLFGLLFTMGSICFYSGQLWKKIDVSMGRFPVVALIFALVLTLSGCQIVEPEKRAYPLVLGIDWVGEEYAIYLAMAKLAQSTGQEKSGSEQEVNWLVLKGKNSKEIQKMYDASEELYLDVGHIQAMVFGEKLLEEEERAILILKELEQNHDLGNSTYVFETKNMEELFSKNGKQVDSLGDYLTGLYENRVQKRTPETLMDIYRVLHNENRLPKIPELKVLGEKIELIIE